MGNPLIEALPLPLTKERIFTNFLYLPSVGNDELLLPAEERRFCVNALFSFRQPQPHHGQIGLMLDELIREGLVGRNPFVPGTLTHTHFSITEGTDGIPPPSPEQLTAKAGLVSGLSGMGKSTGMLRILTTCYQQVIQHTSYKGKPLPELQVVWLYVRIPYNASLKEFILAFFEALDMAIYGPGIEHYYAEATRLGGNNRSLVRLFRKRARQHHLGVIVVDELQWLSIKRSRGSDEIGNFLHELLDIVGIPILFCGTYKAYDLLLTTVHETRRTVSIGKIDCVPKTADSGEWKQFWKSLRPLQWLKHPEALSDQDGSLVHDLIQGVYDFAIKLFTIAQWRAMANGSEKIDAAILRSIMANELSPLRGALEQIKNPDKGWERRYEDLMPGEDILAGLVSHAGDSLFIARMREIIRNEIDAVIPKYTSNTELHGKGKDEGESPETHIPDVRSVAKSDANENPARDAIDLRAAAQSTDPVEALKKMGLIASGGVAGLRTNKSRKS